MTSMSGCNSSNCASWVANASYAAASAPGGNVATRISVLPLELPPPALQEASAAMIPIAVNPATRALLRDFIVLPFVGMGCGTSVVGGTSAAPLGAQPGRGVLSE